MAVSCLLSIQKHLMLKGHEVITDIVTNGSILPKVRNGIVKRFLDSNADTLLFIDSDMIIDPHAAEKLIEAPFDCSVINYRGKNNTVKWMAEPIYIDGQPVGVIRQGDVWLQTNQAGTGAMAIKRETLMEMVNAYPELAYDDNNDQIPCLFDFMLIDGKYYGEDYTFCHRLKAIGGQIFILANSFAGHIGDTVYSGSYHEYLQGV